MMGWAVAQVSFASLTVEVGAERVLLRREVAADAVTVAVALILVLDAHVCVLVHPSGQFAGLGERAFGLRGGRLTLAAGAARAGM